jgi:hypothetical protein
VKCILGLADRAVSPPNYVFNTENYCVREFYNIFRLNIIYLTETHRWFLVKRNLIINPIYLIMKSLNNFKLILLVSFAFACSPNKEQQTTSDSNEVPLDTVAAADNVTDTPPQQSAFAGEYLIGDGNTYIVPVANTFEIQDGTGEASDVLTFQGKENDTLSVYSNKDKSVTFKMNPDHKTGKYYSAGEELPVEMVGPLEQ